MEKEYKLSTKMADLLAKWVSGSIVQDEFDFLVDELAREDSRKEKEK